MSTLTGTVRTGGGENTGDFTSILTGTVGMGWGGEHRRPGVYPHRNSQNRALAENIGDPVSTHTCTVRTEGGGEHRRPCVYPHRNSRNRGQGEHRRP